MPLTPEDLKKMSTPSLMKAHRNARLYYASPAELEHVWVTKYARTPILAMMDGYKFVDGKLEQDGYLCGNVFGYESYVSTTITFTDLKRELNSRPHVPNKKESKALRKQKIKSSKGRGRRDR